MRRREFLAAGAATAALAAAGTTGCAKTRPPLPPGSLGGADLALGHRLRQPDFPAPTEVRRVTTAIVGAGVGGLAAGWRLAREGMDDFLLLELEKEAGGNSRAGRNAVSAHPLGAHYLPLPPREARAVKVLLRELGALKGGGERAADYDETYLCHAPQERLFRQGYWQEGLLPTLGVPAAERDQYLRFQEQVARLRERRDFTVPLAFSSRRAGHLALDRTDFRSWLRAEGYTAPGLHWLADYACRDDYGTAAAETSAWAGLHYFACRESDGHVLTAPDGNAWLARGLAAPLGPRVLSSALVWRVEETKREVAIDVYLAAENRSLRLLARELVWAAPLFLLPRVFVAPRPAWTAALAGIDYAPWVVANLTLSAPPMTRAGAGLAWDNVIEASASLGYVVATHQAMRYAPGPTVITWYRALHEESAHHSPSRQRLLLRDREAWAEEILADLEVPHPEIRELVTRLDVHRHAHAMIRPRPGRLWSGARAAFEGQAGRIRFAHADVSGLSLFEEAHYRGVKAAEDTLGRLGVSYSSIL